MIELLALSFFTRQLTLVIVCVIVGLAAISAGFLLFLKIKAVKKELSVESLPTLIDLGLEEDEELNKTFSPSATETDSSAFFGDDDDDDIMQGDFLDKDS